jgi:hypothetical protein
MIKFILGPFIIIFNKHRESKSNKHFILEI